MILPFSVPVVTVVPVPAIAIPFAGRARGVAPVVDFVFNRGELKFIYLFCVGR